MSARNASSVALDTRTNEPVVRTAQGDLDVLTDLEVKIARRADQIAAEQPSRPGSNLYCWLTAEHEILASADYLDRPLRQFH
jgi:hypothetical protein